MTSLLLLFCLGTADAKPPRPNIIFIMCDNLGYGDLGCLGSQTHRTPHVDRMAAEGMRLTACYSASGVCTPSRAALMTACYPLRVGMHVSDQGGPVLQPVSPKGLHPDEVTIGNVLTDAGYRSHYIGKWHLGDQPIYLPTRRGFADYLGIPYSDDMTPRDGKNWPDLPLMRNELVIDAPVDRRWLTQRYTTEAVEFIKSHRQRPFFLLLSQAMPGSTRAPFARPEFEGKSKNGPYGDSVEELDWSTGEILDAVDAAGIKDRTLVIFTSDNGAVRRNPPQGSNLPWRGAGYSTDEGGMRMPFIARWPGVITPGSTSPQLCSLMDMLPTFAHLAGGPLPNKTIDGVDITPILTGPADQPSPRQQFLYYHFDQLQAVRDARWKLYLPLEEKRRTGNAVDRNTPAELFDLLADPQETQNRHADEPQTVARLMQIVAAARQEIGDVNQPGRGARQPGTIDHEPTPRALPGK